MLASDIGPGFLVLRPFPQRHLDIRIWIIINFFTNPNSFDAADGAFAKPHQDRYRIGIRNRNCLTVATFAAALCFPVLMGREIIIINDVAADTGCP